MTVDNAFFVDRSQPSLQEALDKARRDRAISDVRLPRVQMAVATFARLMRRPSTELPSHRGFIIQQLRRLRRSPTGLSTKTLSNTRSELLYLVSVTGGRGPRSVLPLSNEWKRFRDALQHGPSWWSVSRLAGFSSRLKVSPADVNDGHIEAFCTALQNSGEVSDAAGHTRRVTRVWNKLVVGRLAGQISALTLTHQGRRRWTLPETSFPRSFRDDVEKWFKRLTSNDPFSSGPRRALRPATIRNRRHQLFKAASALVFSGREIERARSLGDLVTVEAFQELLGHLLERQSGRITEALHGLAGGLLAIGRHHVGVDEETEARLATIVANLDRGAVGFRTKTRTRLKPFEEDRHVAALLNLPARLCADAKKAKSLRKRKHLAEMAIAVEILTFAPLRISNLVSLRLDATLRKSTRRRERHWLITIPAEQVKNRTDLTFELSRDRHDLIGKALALYDQPNGWLFPGRATGPKDASLLSGQIKRAIESRLGLVFHAHMFRALAGYLHLRENPNGFEAVRALLGNRDDQVVRNNYAFLAERSLIADAQASISKTRLRLTPPERKPEPK